MQLSTKARIIGLGSYLPERVMSNQNLERLVDTSDEWIVSRTGIKERRIARPDEYPSDMGAEAAKKALVQAGISAAEIDMILVATMCPDYMSPSTAALIQSKIGATKAAAVDLQAACTGYIYGLSMAKAYIESGLYRTVLLIASEKMSSIIDYTDRNTCVLFGDGASAAVISGKGSGLLVDFVCLGSDGELAHLISVPGGGARHPANIETVQNKLHYFKMEGREVFKHAIRRMSAAAQECLRQAGLKVNDLNWLVPHQANIRIVNAMAEYLNMPLNKVYQTLQKYGNTSAASVAIALDELIQTQKIDTGERLLLVAFGGGLTWGASILTKVQDE